ncbi:MAG: ABC transporter ATP-binding protein [Bacteroidetes bacterium]|nr:ABC transporter ATP-binding protein [Bacteroidota bacterium]
MDSKKAIDLTIFFRLLSFSKSYKSFLFISVTCTLLLSIVSPLRPALIGFTVDSFMIKSQDPEALLNWTILIIGILFFEGIIQLTGSYFSNLLAQSVIYDIRKRLFKHIMTFRMRYFDQTPVGSLITRVVSDLEAVTEVFASGLMEIAGDLISLIFVLILMFSTNWQLSLMTLIPIPLLLFATRIFARAMRSSFQLEREQVNKLNTFVQERLTGMALVQLFNRQDKEYENFKEINKGHRQAHINAVWANSIFFPVVEMLSSLSIAFLLVWGALQISGKTSAEIKTMYAQIIAFTLWINQLYRPIRQLADKFNILQRGTVRAERIFEILDIDEHIQQTGSRTDIDFNSTISFSDVSFAYNKEEYVLKNVNLSINPGEIIAFVGATGAGKTTIVNLLGRFYEYQKGEIKIGEIELSQINLMYLRKHIAIVLQDVFLFSDSVHNNITLGDKKFSRDEVIQAAKAVGAHDFIMKLPSNYDYKIGERGGVLSTGQKQLLAFIRAYIYNPHILILDEATSSVDSESEEMIQKATEKLTDGRTSIIIAHRLSTIQKANKIVVLEKGEIVEMGSHIQLLKKDGYYKKLYEMQFVEIK